MGKTMKRFRPMKFNKTHKCSACVIASKVDAVLVAVTKLPLNTFLSLAKV